MGPPFFLKKNQSSPWIFSSEERNRKRQKSRDREEAHCTVSPHAPIRWTLHLVLVMCTPSTEGLTGSEVEPGRENVGGSSSRTTNNYRATRKSDESFLPTSKIWGVLCMDPTIQFDTLPWILKSSWSCKRRGYVSKSVTMNGRSCPCHYYASRSRQRRRTSTRLVTIVVILSR
jgi:hypothetical protein